MAVGKWEDGEDISHRADYASIMAEIEAEQADHPGMWGEVRRFPSPNTAGDRANRLKQKYAPHFEVRSTKDRATGEGVVWARYVGGDRDFYDSQD